MISIVQRLILAKQLFNKLFVGYTFTKNNTYQQFLEIRKKNLDK